MTRVRCYAATRYPERPLSIEWEGRWLEVTVITRQAAVPDGMIFDVAAEDGRRFELTWTQEADQWSVRVLAP